MASDIRPTGIGFAFGAVAGMIIGGWYMSGTGKLDLQACEESLTEAQNLAETSKELLGAAYEAKKTAENAVAECQGALEAQSSP